MIILMKFICGEAWIYGECLFRVCGKGLFFRRDFAAVKCESIGEGIETKIFREA